MLRQRSVTPVQDDPASPSLKSILLRPEIRYDDESTWPMTVADMVRSGEVSLGPWSLRLGYEAYSAHDILMAVLPEELLDEVPTGYNLVGHVAQINLHDQFLPYKKLIGEVVVDKNPGLRTVINKIDTLQEGNAFRVLDYEVLSGDPSLQVEVVEARARFRFDFSKVFWNSRLGTEHERMVAKFKQGEVVCDVMAGVGPFVIPAGRKKVWALANDLNPDCVDALRGNIALNQVSSWVFAYMQDGHDFIPHAAEILFNEPLRISVRVQTSRADTESKMGKPSERAAFFDRPRIVSHYVMNLPSIAPDFLADFIGLYHGKDSYFTQNTDEKLPMIHCYCFGPKPADDDRQNSIGRRAICELISSKLCFEIRPDTAELEIFHVRDVAPKKTQYCASFRLPAEVAFRKRSAAE